MKIAIDISQIVYGTGISVYTENLVKNLLLVDRENDYILFGGSLRRISDLENFTSSLTGRFSKRIVPIPPALADLLWNKLHIFSMEMLVGPTDVFHSSDWAQPPSRAFKVTTVHDLTPIKFAKVTDPKIVSAHKARLGWVIKEVDRIIVPSQATKEDLIALGAKEERIRVIPEGVDEIYKPAAEEEIKRIRNKYKINGEYLISVGVGGRKNTDRIIDAYERVKSKSLKLALVGRSEKFYDTKRGVLLLKSVPKEDLPILYSGAQALVYPSLYEGFGLPILEAFSCGTPVVTSNISSMPEVAGSAAVLVDPYSVESIVEGIRKVLKGRKGLLKKGLKRVNEFSWDKTAKETLDVYYEAKASTSTPE